ncbi:MAG: GNAT family N-acetyltransferase [Bacteroidales bacterium]
MKIELIKDKSSLIVDKWMPLYESSFPAYECTDENQFRNMIEHPQMFFYSVSIEEELVGFYCLWDLEECYYLLYIVTIPHFRNQKIGQRILEHIQNDIDKPLFLETEKAVDETTTRRVNFYKRNGFMVLADNPSTLYDIRDKKCKLLFMGTKQVDDLTPCLIKVRDVVYDAMTRIH